MGKDNLAFVMIKGFEEYASILIENTFSVYKMPAFDVIVDKDAFLLR